MLIFAHNDKKTSIIWDDIYSGTILYTNYFRESMNFWNATLSQLTELEDIYQPAFKYNY